MSELNLHSAGGTGGGSGGGPHHPPVKLIVAAVAVVAVLLLMRKRASGGTSAAAPSTGAGTDSTGTLGDAEMAMLSALQTDNARVIGQQLALIPRGATGPIGKQGPTGPIGHGGSIPPGTVHKPVKPKPGGHPGVPAVHGHFVTVAHGDTLSGIAQRNHVSNWRRLLNPKTDSRITQHPNLITPGEKVWIPQ